MSYRLPWLRHCFVLCSEVGKEPGDEIGDAAKVDLMAFFLIEAQRLAQTAVGDPEAFMLIHSGRSARKRSSWHLHVFVVRTRWQKAWVYTILGVKNLVLASGLALRNRFTKGRVDGDQRIRRPATRTRR
ncbi:MAG: hypothetical protein J7598_01390 [Mitsuaria chitosanitabida]|uniref:hypothetical protein n=1 Tax=Roseateles chitosanitabidus TaxID=65048 RepID=UPI001AFD0077|nr:hypothetical protein [Roseateles chitosanitabidus]MBO9685240.1 hypothetical protein [Roseateles chitosanitabidus]